MGWQARTKRFIEEFSQIASPLTMFTQKNIKFIWSEKYEESFRELGKMIITAPILATPSGIESLAVCCDIFKHVIVCVFHSK